MEDPMQNNNDQSTNSAPRPQVAYVRLLESDNLSECPTDQYHLIHIVADLDYSRDHRGGSVVKLPAKLSFCPACKTWYIDRLRLAGLARQGVDLRCIDIVGSAAYPRPEAYEAWHPLPVKTEPETAPAAARKAPASKTAAPARSAGSSASRGEPTAKSRPSELNLAFRSLYCDGGQSGRLNGYRGVCSQETFFSNIAKDKASWCASPENRCRDIALDEQPEGDGLCMECRLLLDWEVSQAFDAGMKGHPAASHIGGIALITTVLPRESEVNRRLVAAFLIADQKNTVNGPKMIADSKLRLELAIDEPVYFWKALSAKGQPDSSWNGNSRPVIQSSLVRILYRAARVVKDPERRAIADKLYKQASARFSEAQLKKILS